MLQISPRQLHNIIPRPRIHQHPLNLLHLILHILYPLLQERNTTPYLLLLFRYKLLRLILLLRLLLLLDHLRRLLLSSRFVMTLQLTKILQLPTLQKLLNTTKMLLHLTVTELIKLIHKPVKEITVVRNNDKRTVVSLQSLLQNILGTDIHMVRRLVKSKKIIRLENQLCHSKPCPLTTAQHRHLLVNILTFEKKSTKNIPQFKTDIPHSNSIQSTEDSILLIKYIFLILSVITNVYIISDIGLSCHWFKLPHDHAHQRRLTLTVPAHKSHLLSPPHLNLRILEHNLLTITHLHVHRLVDNLTRTRSRRELHSKSRPVLQIHLNPLQLLQLLHTRLHLIGLRRLVAETLDELLSLLDHTLLVLIGSLLLGKPFLPEFQVLTIRNLIIMNPADHDLHCPVRHIVEELPVVRNQHKRTLVLLQITLEPLDRLNVKMIRRLVKKKDIRLRQQNLGKLDTHVPALAESLRRPRKLIVLESQTQQSPFRHDLRIVRTRISQTVIDLIHPDYKILIRI